MYIFMVYGSSFVVLFKRFYTDPIKQEAKKKREWRTGASNDCFL